MKLRETSVYSRALAIFLAASVFLLGSVVVLTQGIIMREFEETERREMESTLRLFSLLLEREVQPLDTVARKGAAVADANGPGRGGLSLLMQEFPGTDFLAVCDRDGSIRDLAVRQGAAFFPPAALASVIVEVRIDSDWAAGEVRSGAFLLSDRPAWVSAARTRSGGVLLGGKVFDEGFWSFFGRLFGGTASFRTLESASLTEINNPETSALFKKGGVLVEMSGENRMAGSVLLRGIDEKPIGMFTLSQDRPLRQESIRASRIFLIGVSLAGSILVLVVWLALDRTILKRIADLTRKLDQEKRRGRLPVRLDFSGDDELGTLARSIEDLALRLEKSQSQYRAVVEDQTEMICRFDADLRLAFANRIFLRTFDLDDRALEECRLDVVLPPLARREFIAQFSRLNPENDLTTAVQEIEKEGRTMWLRSTLRGTFTPDRRCAGGQWVLSDISAQIEAQRQLRRLSAQLLRLQDEERRRIARELHDSTAQNLSALEMNMSLLEPMLAASPRAAKLIGETRRIADECSKELRNMAYLLHPPLIDEAGLAFAIQWFADGFAKRTGISSTVEIEDDFPRLDPDVEMPLFRVVQEAMTNIYRHSGADQAWVSLQRENGAVVLEVRDNGHGFAPPTGTDGHHPGVGLTGIRERLAHLGGKLDIANSTFGVTITIIVPFDQTGGARTIFLP